MLRPLTHVFLAIVPPVLFTESMNCVRNIHMKFAYVRLNRVLFTPLIFLATGGMANEATMFYKRLASLLLDKWDSNYESLHHPWES